MILFGAIDIDGKSIYIMDEKFDLSPTLLEPTSHWHLIYSPKMFLVHKINGWTTRIRLISILNERVCVPFDASLGNITDFPSWNRIHAQKTLAVLSTENCW